MFKDPEANLHRALAFEAELRTWLAGCSLDEDQIAEAIIHVYASVLQNIPRRLSGEKLRRQTFAFAQEFVLAHWREPLAEAAAPDRRLPDLPPRAGVGNLRLAKLAAAERQRLAVWAVSHRCYEVFLLYKIKQLTQPEIARRLSITESAVESELAAAARACANAMGHTASLPVTAAPSEGGPGRKLLLSLRAALH
jgi:DNA-directed RNA polymerase specialized sigma24 family protein